VGLGVVEFWLAVEDEFDVANEAYCPSSRLSDICGAVMAELNRLGRATDPDEVWRRLRRLTSEQARVPEDEITPESDVVRDLGISS
jgi:hypothetical protein